MFKYLLLPTLDEKTNEIIYKDLAISPTRDELTAATIFNNQLYTASLYVMPNRN
jgi:hypothetical protein